MTRSKIYVIAGLVLMVHLLSTFFYSRVLTKNGLQRRKETLFQKQKNNNRIWIMGDSHPMLALNPDWIPESFNLASTSENYFLNYVKLLHLLDTKNTPEILILPIELHSFSALGKNLLLNHEMDDVYWADKAGWGFLKKENLETPFFRWWISARFFPYAGQFYRFTSLWKNEAYTLNNKGFPTVTEDFSQKSGSDRMSETSLRFNGHFLSHSPTDSFQIRYLKKIKDLCREKKIELVFVQFPVADEYLALARSRKDLSDVERWIELETRSYPVLKYRNLFTGQPDFFCDPDHLNIRGAELLSKRLAEALKFIRRKPVAKP